MLGYIVPQKPELKVREYELYGGYYCGICRSVARRYGQLPRLVLSYDAVFLALVLASVSPEKEMVKEFRCGTHPTKKRRTVEGEAAVDYAADMMLLLAYYKVLDDCRDEGSLKAAAEKVFLHRFFKKLMKRHKEKGIIVNGRLQELSLLEEERCASLDQAAEPFAKLLEEIFAWEGTEDFAEREEALRRTGYHLGKWIYLIDAYDDIAEDLKTGSYNPLVYRFEYDSAAGESAEAFRERIRERVEFNLLRYLAELAEAWKALAPEKNRELIDNIIYFGLLQKTEQVLGKSTEKGTEAENHGESI